MSYQQGKENNFIHESKGEIYKLRKEVSENKRLIEKMQQELRKEQLTNRRLIGEMRKEIFRQREKM